MDFSLTEEQIAIQEGVRKTLEPFTDDYWLEHDRTGEFPHEFYQAMAEGGWLGITMPTEYGGSGLGVTEAALMMHEVAKNGGMSSASAIHINLFGPHPIVVYGTDEQKKRWIPDLVEGKAKACFGVTEPDAGLNTTGIKTRAEKTVSGDFVVNGQKIWTSTGQVADKVMLLTRTTPKEEGKKATDGMTLFYTDFKSDHIEVREIEKMGRKCVDSNQVFYDNLPVSKEDMIGEEGKGFYYLLDSLNPERVLIAMEATGIAKDALRRASTYARERVVFDRPIGMNQGIQHPLAECWCEIEAAYLMAMQAATLYDNGEPCGPFANAAKYLAASVGFKTATQAVMTHGGMGYAKEFHVERLFRESIVGRIAPVSEQLILSNIAERVLDLPKSY
ncbi:MAG: acyl-CoA/acyl-ACP dehydrogenase [Gammaproteobacteria bacterium]|nr:acyl-CoA/acyl-ACP dehydrogenase [Gammaproteobacteria bacterium]